MASGVDPIAGVGQMLAVFVGASAAAIWAPHAVVVISGAAGGILGLMSWRSCSGWAGARYVIGMCALAWLFAGSAAEIMTIYVGIEDKRLVSPMALVIGWIGHRWPAVGKWAARLARTMVETAMRGQK